ncbi:hypothetical protein DDB_G0284635 [Dictyostelium discoideum AX4]|uniref:Uncharacterized protein n=1 Tax=Dictyostelium discoideum TaxID=44689 RepID=Q54PD1_DICDI|nr:hypothetical protein DDB_G0284635 [Dictyostelium discoideum AX4]EAL65087.1 hypothetical protein DDB_G0284635 [Dictyostelium discoideum AX4]|eukprot:XP_638444.1 hypothetical protein DDB_G0284635 [Dictyostelium discoideum AX4]
MIFETLNKLSISNLSNKTNIKIDCSCNNFKTNVFGNSVSNTNKVFYNETKASYTRPYWSYFNSHIVATKFN